MLFLAGYDDNEWQPPTEAEMKIMQARRERSEKISKIMGAYLLKGYKMLGSNCPECGVSENLVHNKPLHLLMKKFEEFRGLQTKL